MKPTKKIITEQWRTLLRSGLGPQLRAHLLSDSRRHRRNLWCSPGSLVSLHRDEAAAWNQGKRTVLEYDKKPQVFPANEES